MVQNENYSAISNFGTIKESLDIHLKDIKSSYLIKREIEREIPTRTIEERMYQLCNNVRLDCENKFKTDHEYMYLQLNAEKMKYEKLSLEYNSLLSSRNDLNSKFEEIKQSQDLLFSSEKSKNGLLQSKINSLMDELKVTKDEFDQEKNILIRNMNVEKARISDIQHKFNDIVNTMNNQAERFEDEKRSLNVQ